ncbi:MAG TPA: sulfite exporter TauE/SafE family protein [Burkholderiales bacterium]|nr:sulfite exporter TauE/SafE family protein [Burkholderiales bacterium]
MTFAVAAAALLAGTLIGLTGIGGVLLVPALTSFSALPLDRAIAASMMGFLLAGVAAAVVHLRHSSLRTSALAALCATAALGAAAGAMTLELLPPAAVRLFIAVLALASGLHALVAPAAAPAGRIPSPPALGALGIAVGYGSAISGTGGPVLLIPMLLALRTPARSAIALGLAAQVPIVLAATLVNLHAARVDFELGGALALLLLAGAWVGSATSRRLSARVATVAVALTLIATGLWYGFATVAGQASNTP